MHYHLSFLYTRVLRDLSSVPKDVKILIFGMFVYMLAWGIIEPFLSIYIHSIVKSYSLAGLFYGLFFLVGAVFSVPVGDLADKVNKIKYAVLSMLSYPIIGLFYFSLAFVHSSLVLLALFFARILHGFGSLLWIPVEGFIRENSPKGKTSATFGLYMTFHRLAYVLAPLFVIPIILLFSLTPEKINWLLLALIPFPIIAALIISKVKDSGETIAQGIEEVVVKDGIFKKELLDLKAMGFVGAISLLIGFFMRSIQAIVIFLLPLYALSLNLGLIEISLLFAAINLPYLLSFFFAELADSLGKINLISAGFVLAAISLLAISLTSSLSITFFVACLALGLILALIQPAVNGLITDITPRVQDGEMTGIFSAVLKVSGFASVLALGILADAFSLQFPFLVFALILLGMAVLTYSIKGKVVVRI